MNITKEKKIGLFCGVSAFVFWGLVPVYFKALQHVPPATILAHRVVWSVPMTALLITLGRDWAALGRAIRSGKVFFTLLFTALLVTANWFLFIYAINTCRVLQGSLGYYINPLVNVLLGTVFLRERLRPRQVLAVMLALAGTLNLALRHSEVPWISLGLAASFGLYGLLRKTVLIEAVNGLFVETALMFPFALGFLIFQGIRGQGAFWAAGWQTTALLFLAGAVTTFPLVWFTSAARRLNYSTVGLLQYIAPTLMFFLGVFRYGEPFTAVHTFTFGCIWTGLAIIAADSLIQQRASVKDQHVYNKSLSKDK